MTEVSPRVDVLNEAARLIDGDRNVSYGTPTQNFANIAEMWTTQFRHKLVDGATFDASDIADALMLLKIARNIAQKKRDNYVDIAGYAGCGYETILPPEPPVAVKLAGFTSSTVVDAGTKTFVITLNENSLAMDTPALSELIAAKLHQADRP